jgi:hypothetical protein
VRIAMKMNYRVHSKNENDTSIEFNADVNGQPFYVYFVINTPLWDSDRGGALGILKSRFQEKLEQYVNS